MLLFAVDLSAHPTASVSPLDVLCLVNRNSIRLIGAGQSTHNLQAAVTQEDRSFLLSSLRWGKVDCLMGGSACSWLLFQFPDLFYLPELCSELWWSVTGEDIPAANPDCVWIPDSSRGHLSCSLFSISELLLRKAAKQPAGCLGSGSLLSAAVFPGHCLVLNSVSLMAALAFCSSSDLSLPVHGGSACSVQTERVWSAGREVPSGSALCARGARRFHEDFELSREGCWKSQSKFSSCHDFFPFVPALVTLWWAGSC